MKPGLRVVRGPDWKYEDQDGGEGHVGTVVEIGGQSGSQTPEKHVTVVWDSGARHQYRAGHEDAYDLYVYDNAQCGTLHRGSQCVECQEEDIKGLRWKCSVCQDVNLCTQCYMADRHDDASHSFLRYDHSASDGHEIAKRSETNSDRRSAVGIFKGAKVCRGPDWKWGTQDGGADKEGEVVRVSNWGKSFRAEIGVKWTTGEAFTYRLGVGGKVDLKCIVPSPGGCYYKTHLPVVGKMQADESLDRLDLSHLLETFAQQLRGIQRTQQPEELLEDEASSGEDSSTTETTTPFGLGYRVVRGPHWRWDKQDHGEGYVGTVVDMAGTGTSNTPADFVTVKWDCGSKNSYRTGRDGAYDLLVFDNAQDGTRHKDVTCDECRTVGIQGIRWKCFVCHNYDLCSSCYGGDRHDLTHQFVRIDNPWSKKFYKLPNRLESQKVHAMGIFPGATVSRGQDWRYDDQDGNGKEGTVETIADWEEKTGRSKVNVKWATGASNGYRLGHLGKVDLNCVKATSGGCYYRSHMPFFGKIEKPIKISQFNVGEKVKCGLDIEELKKKQEKHGGFQETMVQFLNKIGTVVSVTKNGDIVVQYKGEVQITYNPQALSSIWLNSREVIATLHNHKSGETKSKVDKGPGNGASSTHTESGSENGGSGPKAESISENGESSSKTESGSESGESISKTERVSENGESSSETESVSQNGESSSKTERVSDNVESSSKTERVSENVESSSKTESGSESGESSSKTERVSENVESSSKTERVSENGESSSETKSVSENGESSSKTERESDNGESSSETESVSQNGESSSKTERVSENVESSSKTERVSQNGESSSETESVSQNDESSSKTERVSENGESSSETESVSENVESSSKTERESENGESSSETESVCQNGESSSKTERVSENVESSSKTERVSENGESSSKTEHGSENVESSSKTGRVSENGECSAKTEYVSENVESSAKAESDSSIDKPQCHICTSEEACVAFVPCGHLITCPECATDLDTCPLCRADIENWLRTFIL